ncbi:hypothetical protein VKT23_008476 [Stygiomarasmius scandens]|uniref:Major facilitator superfamily (MFS) profile domain-containing protein n=1 Tax=Marasmiellus scandens TaxID=2682957 RepID=A0ABR1JH59_9AGAR
MSKHPHYQKKGPEDVQVDVLEIGLEENRKERSTLRSVLLVATCTIALMAHTSNNIAISITLPIIQRALNVPQVQLQWIVSAYALSSGCLLLVFGRLADLYGRKRVFLFGITWLTAFTLGCSFAKDSLTLDILRGLQGIGSAATIPAAIGTLAATFPPSRARTIAFATFSAGSPLGSTLGVIVGGVLNQVTSASWKASFYLNAVLAFLAIVGSIYSFEPDKPSRESDRRVDWIGAFLITSGLVLIVFILGEGEVAPKKWATSYIIALLVSGVVLTLLFGFWQHYLEHVQDGLRDPIRILPSPPPLMRLSLWRRSKWRVTVVMIIAFLNWASFVGWNFWTILYYENFSALSPIATVLRLVPQFIVALLCNVLVARLVGRVPLVILIAAGTGLSGIASLLFAIIDPDASYWAFGFPSAILSVFGANFVYPSGTLFIATVSAQFEQSVGGAVFQLLTQLGSSAGVAASTVVFNRVLQKGAEDQGLEVTGARGNNLPRDVQLDAYRAAEWTNFAFAILAMILAIAFLSSVGIIGQRAPGSSKRRSQPQELAEQDANIIEIKQEITVPVPSLTPASQTPTSLPSAELKHVFPWSQLRELELLSCDLETALMVLNSSSENLVHCRFGRIAFNPGTRNTDFHLPTSSRKVTSISVPRLQSLSIHLNEAGPLLLDSLTLPSLYDLTLVKIKFSSSIDQVISLLVRSASLVKRLKVLGGFPLMDVTLVRLLRQTPCLEMLEMNGWIWDEILLKMTTTATGSTGLGPGPSFPVLNPLVPRLKTLRLYGKRIFHLDVLQNMLNSRIMGSSGEDEFGIAEITDPREDEMSTRLKDIFLHFQDKDRGRNGSPSMENRDGNSGLMVDVRNATHPLTLYAKSPSEDPRTAADLVRNWDAALSDTLLGEYDIDVENLGIIDEILSEIEWYSRSAERFLGSSIIRSTLQSIASRQVTDNPAFEDLQNRITLLAQSLR